MKKLVLITGASKGIGRATALALAKEGYAVSGCARGGKALRALQDESGGEIRTASIDVCQENELRNWIETQCEGESCIPWAMITAAGIHGAISPLSIAAWEEWKKGVSINLFGSVYAAKCMSEILIRRNLPGRILFLSGGGASKPIPHLSSYCASKAAIVRCAETIAHELAPHKISVNAIAPGAVNTSLTQTIVEAGPERAGLSLYRSVERQLQDPSHTPDKAVQLIKYLLEESSAPIQGRLISAIWDDWHNLHNTQDFLENREIFTLRRIVSGGDNK